MPQLQSTPTNKSQTDIEINKQFLQFKYVFVTIEPKPSQGSMHRASSYLIDT